MKYFYKLIITLFLFTFLPLISSAQENQAPLYLKGEVDKILETSYPFVFGREVEFQRLQVQLEGGQVTKDVFNDYTPVKVGDIVYLREGYDSYSDTLGHFVLEVDRRNSIYIIIGIFILIYVAIAGIKGLRSILALAITVSAVWFVLIPLIISGYDPLTVGLLISTVILGVAIFVTHGINIVSLSSYIGSIISIFITIIFAKFAFSISRISGTVNEESTSIAFLYGSSIDIKGLLLSAMIIGILGVLDDVAVMQAAMVREFMYDKKHSLKKIFTKSMRVGKEHAAALVNTLVLAYTAVALPLFLIILAPLNTESTDSLPLSVNLSNELFVIEIIRSIVGSIGLVVTIPLVTAIAIFLFSKYPPKEKGEFGHIHH